MKLFALILVFLLAGCQQFPALPAGVVGVNLTYTIAPVVEPTAAPDTAIVVAP